MSRIETIAEGVTLHCGDCLDVLVSLAEGSVDSCVTDPPYHLTSIVKRFGADDAAPAKVGKTGAYARASAGFMGKKWDGGDLAFRVETWAAVFRVLKPGAHLIAFSGTRTYHRIACAIEDAGFEVRDQIGWAYGSGFPKSHNAGDGWGTALKPAWEPMILARKPLMGTVAENVREHGTGAINIDGCRVHTADDLNGGAYSGAERRREEYTTVDSAPDAVALSRLNRGIGEFQQPLGRWPANIIHDGSDEVVAAFPHAPGQQREVNETFKPKTGTAVYGDYGPRPTVLPRNDGGSAARFFYTAKADSNDRLGSKHPTVKPVDLMQYLVRLVTPKGGLVLDPFAGTGTTGEAAFREGMRAILIEREPEYQADIRRRAKLFLGGPDERRHATLKAAGKVEGPGPLFAESYDATADFAGSLEVAYDAIRTRKAAGGPGWEPK